MNNGNRTRIKDLIDRLARINAADEWEADLNPTQWTALTYLARANRFSRSPSQVSDFMTATRGTVSQTLKALARKGLIEEIRSELDKRSISYTVTAKGAELAGRHSIIEAAVARLTDTDSTALENGLDTLLRQALKQRGLRPFGVCAACRHHQSKQNGGFCILLQEPLTCAETTQICHEYQECV